MRGEYLLLCSEMLLKPGSPPLARGIHTQTIQVSDLVGITPACAGNTRLGYSPGEGYGDHPRLRGEYFDNPSKLVQIAGSPPLARGILVMSDDGITPIGITPACAGNTSSAFSASCFAWDHPRLRGEYCCAKSLTSTISGSPPLARGILTNRLSAESREGITPACAGNTFFFLFCLSFAGDHPRLRGEYRKKQMR